MAFVFPYPEDSDLPPIVVPYYPSPKYDHTAPNSFVHFAQRNGFTLSKSSSDLDITRDPADLAALMQSWLYFGLIDEIVSCYVDRMLFLVNPEEKDGQNFASGVIDIRINIYLDKLLDDYRKAENDRQPSIQETRLYRIRRHLSYAFKKCTEFETIDVPIDSALPPVCLSVRLLLLHLKRTFENDGAKPSVYGESPAEDIIPQNPPLQLSSTSNIPPVALLLARGRNSGLCMRTLFSNGSTFDYAILYYLTSLKRSVNAEFHRSCTKNYCQLGNISQPDARAHHRRDGCQCMKRYPPAKDIVEAIRNGDIPLISLSLDATGCVQLSVVKGSTNIRYVAISHIWSDNQLCSEDNGLYQCQLEWLAALVSRVPQDFRQNIFRWEPQNPDLPKEQLFWLDTLCVPMDEEHIDVRKQAIDQMDLVYAGASKVLVLDSELQQINVEKQEILVPRHGLTESSRFLKALKAPKEKSLLLIAAYIFRSQWMSRAWTLQEGFLARDCALQLRDGTVEIGHLDLQAYGRTVQSPLYIGISPWLHSSVIIYTMIRFLFCRPSYVTKSNLILHVIDGTHAGIIMLLSLFINLIMWPILIFNGYWDPNYYDYQKPSPLANEYPERFDEYLPICDSLCKEVRDSLDQLATLSGDRSHEKRFIRAWKALLSRSTTKSEDIHAIVANLTGFSAREVLEYENIGERMRSMFHMFSILPLDILYVDGVKYRSEIYGADQWMPIWPCDSVLTSHSSMVFEPDGYMLKLHHTDHLYAIEGGAVTSRRCKMLAWKLPAEEATMSTNWIEILDVTCLGIEDEKEQDWVTEQIGREHYLLVERVESQSPASKAQERGALLHSVRRDGEKHFLQYDCSVRIRRSFAEAGSTAPIQFIKEPSIIEELYLQRDCTLQDRPLLSRRPLHPGDELGAGIGISIILATQIYLCSIWMTSVLAFRLRRMLPPQMITFAPTYTAVIIFYILFAFCIVLPVSQWGINTLLSLAALNTWKSTFQTGRAFKKRPSAWGLLHRYILEWRKAWRKFFPFIRGLLPNKFKAILQRFFNFSLPFVIIGFIIFELVVAPIMISLYMFRNEQRWVTHNTRPITQKPIPALPSGHCWSDDGQNCLNTGFVLHSLPVIGKSSCWSQGGLGCLSLGWNGSASTASNFGWWNGTAAVLIVEDGGNGTATTLTTSLNGTS